MIFPWMLSADAIATSRLRRLISYLVVDLLPVCARLPCNIETKHLHYFCASVERKYCTTQDDYDAYHSTQF